MSVVCFTPHINIPSGTCTGTLTCNLTCTEVTVSPIYRGTGTEVDASVWKSELYILDIFDGICKKHGLRLILDAAHMAVTNNAYFLHCLPVRRNMIVSDEVIDSPQSLVIPEAANRVVSAQVVMKRMLESL